MGGPSLYLKHELSNERPENLVWLRLIYIKNYNDIN